MLDRTNLASALQLAGVPIYPRDFTAAYAKAELLRQRPHLWRVLHRVHPTLPYSLEWMNIVAYAIATALFCIVVLSLIDPIGSRLELNVLVQVVFLILGLLICFAGLEIQEAFEEGRNTRWDLVTPYEYEQRLLIMPKQAHEFMDAIRKVTDRGEFKLWVVGNDPILTFGLPDDEFEPRERHTILIWDDHRKIVSPRPD